MAIWLSLIVLVAGIAGGIAFVVVRGLALWRQLKSTGGVFESEADRISAAAAQIEEQLARAEASSANLSAAAGRFRASRSTLDVQIAAAREARATIARMLWFLPGA